MFNDVLELIFLLRPPIVILENVLAFLQFNSLVFQIQMQAAAMSYVLIQNVQNAAVYLPHHRKRVGLILVRSDICITPPSSNLFRDPTLTLALPCPPTVQHRGIFFQHPINAHTAVDPTDYASLMADRTNRDIGTQLQCLCTKYRNNLHFPPPRLGQWLNHQGIAHWIAPRSFARSLGFADHFSLHPDDITSYQHLGNTIAPPTALIWIAISHKYEEAQDVLDPTASPEMQAYLTKKQALEQLIAQ